MRYQLLGRTGLRVSKFLLGAMTFGDEDGVGAPVEECHRMFNAYADAGGNVIDTAINYRGGASERIVGQLLKNCRDRFVLATKYSVSRDQSDPNGGGNHRKNLMLSLETSLRRLNTDYIDLYWVHIWDRRTPIDEMMRALDDAVRAGKVRYIGISDTPAWVVSHANTLADWRGWTPFAGLQVPYSLLKRDIERDLLPMAHWHGLSVAAWSPLGGGILSGKFTGSGAAAATGTRIAPESISDHDHNVATIVSQIAAEIGASPSQVAIAWTMTHSSVVHPILGARRLDQLIDNLGALDFDLPPDAISRLDVASEFDVGFPTDFITETETWVLGQAAAVPARTAMA